LYKITVNNSHNALNYLAYLSLDGGQHTFGSWFHGAGRSCGANVLAFSQKVSNKLAATSDACMVPDSAGSVTLLQYKQLVLRRLKIGCTAVRKRYSAGTLTTFANHGANASENTAA
jgi:hypothetical protein